MSSPFRHLTCELRLITTLSVHVLYAHSISNLHGCDPTWMLSKIHTNYTVIYVNPLEYSPQQPECYSTLGKNYVSSLLLQKHHFQSILSNQHLQNYQWEISLVPATMCLFRNETDWTATVHRNSHTYHRNRQDCNSHTSLAVEFLIWMDQLSMGLQQTLRGVTTVKYQPWTEKLHPLIHHL